MCSYYASAKYLEKDYKEEGRLPFIQQISQHKLICALLILSSWLSTHCMKIVQVCMARVRHLCTADIDPVEDERWLKILWLFDLSFLPYLC